MEEAFNGIGYESYPASLKKGDRFILYPEIGRHTEEDVNKANTWLSFNKGPIGTLQIRWKKSGDDTPQPQRIPSKVIIKNLNIEIGEYKSYIQELEDKIKDMEQQTPEDKKVLAKDKTCQELNKIIQDQSKLIKKLRKESEGLIIKLNTK